MGFTAMLGNAVSSVHFRVSHDERLASLLRSANADAAGY
jgi:hypothetical protein